MRENSRAKKAYDSHKKYLTFKDQKKREYFFVLENLNEDYQSMLNSLSKYSNLNFDFCASCLRDELINVRFFNKEFTGRFSLDKQISLEKIKNQLIKDGYVFLCKSNKSGPLCLNDDFTEPWSAKWFRLKLPIWELKMWIVNYNKCK